MAQTRLPTTRPATADADDLRLADVPLGRSVELIRIDLPDEQMEALMERGLLPGCEVCPVRRSPFGDPILEIDGSMLAVRRETAACLCVRSLSRAS